MSQRKAGKGKRWTGKQRKFLRESIRAKIAGATFPLWFAKAHAEALLTPITPVKPSGAKGRKT